MRLRFHKQKKQIPNFFGMVFGLYKGLFRSENQFPLIQKFRYVYLNLLYKIHLKIRYLHDQLYSRGGRYKKYTDLKISRYIHKTVFTGYVLLVFVFVLIQTVWPIFNPMNPNQAFAGSTTKTWTTNGDFAYNKTSLCGETTKTANVNITGVAYTDNTCAATAADASFKLAGVSNKTYGTGINNVGQLNFSSWNDVISVSAGYDHTLGLRSNGTVVAVGNNVYGQLDVSGWTDIVAISTGNGFSVGLKSNGTVVGAGYNVGGEIDFSSWSGIKAISSSESGRFVVGIKSDGTVIGVGTNTSGQLNFGSWAGITAVSAGFNHTLGVKSDGTVVAVGNNGNGQLDTGSWSNVTTVIAGGNTSYGLRADGTVVAIGTNNWGQLNTGTWSNIYAISTGSNFVLGLKTDGTVVGAGYSAGGEIDVASWRGITAIDGGSGFSVGLSAGRTNMNRNSGTSKGDAISAGHFMTVANKADGTAIAAGRYPSGSGSPITGVSTWTNLKSVAAGYDHVAGVMANGTVVGNGRNSHGAGQINFTGWNNITTIATGNNHTVGLKADGTVLATGDDAYNQVSQVSAWTNIIAVGAGNNHSVGLKADGTVVAVGSNQYGQTDVSSWTGIVAISVRGYVTLGLKSDGTLVGAGNGSHGELNFGSWTGVKEVSSGFLSTAGIIGDGTVVQVGSSLPSTTGWSGISAIAAGSYHLAALKHDGTGLGSISPGTDYGQVTGITSWNLTPVSYSTPATISGFKIDSGAGTKSKWNQIAWVGTKPTNTTIKYNVRTSDDNSTWTSWGADLTVSPATITAANSRYLDVQIVLVTTDILASPVIDSFTVSYDTLEAPQNSNITINKTDGTGLKLSNGNDAAGGVAGAWSNESVVRITASGLTCTGCSTSTNIRPEVEAKPVGTAFDETGLIAAQSGANYALTTGLVTGTNYHIRVRAIDDQGRVSSWVSYGNNAENEADFTIEQTAPTITSFTFSGANVSGNFAKSNLIDLSISASDSGNSTLGSMRFSNNGSTWSNWESYVTTKTNWNLTDTNYGGTTGDGQKTVYVQVRDNAGNITGKVFSSQAEWQSGTLSNLDTSSSGDLKMGPLAENVSGTTNIGSYLEQVAVNRNTNKIYAANYGGGAVNVIDGTTNNIINTISVGNYVFAIDVNSTTNKIYVSRLGGTNTVTVIDGNTNSITNTIAVGASPSAIGVNEATNKIYVANTEANVSGNSVSVIDGATNTVVSTIAVGAQPNGVAINPVTEKIYISNRGSDSVSVINGATNTVINTIALVAGSYPYGIAVNANTNKVYVAKSQTNAISVIDGNSNTVTNNISVGAGPRGVAVNASLNRAYVANAFSNSISVINTDTNIVSNTVTVGSSPMGVYINSENEKIYVASAGSKTVSALTQSFGISGTLGETGTAISYDSGVGNSRKWVALKWSEDSLLIGGQAIKFQISTDGTNWKGPTGSTGDWSTNYFGQVYGGTANTVIPSGFATSRYLYVKMRLESDSSNTPVLHDLAIQSSSFSSITLDTAPPAAFTLASPANNTWQNSATPTFTWNPTSDGNFSKYQLYINDGGTDVLAKDNITPIGTTTAVPDVAIVNQGMHAWYVKAIDSAGNSTNSNTLNVGFDNTAPNAISGVSASQNDPVNINLSWSAYSDGFSPVTNYQIQRVKRSEYDANSLTPTGDWSAQTSFTTITCGVTTTFSEDSTGVKSPLGCILTGQNISTAFSYTYRVRAKDSANPSLWGTWPANYALGMNADVQAPTDPSVVTVTPDPSGYTNQITWNISTDTGSGLSRYLIWRRAESNSTIAVNKITGADITNSENQIWTLAGVLDVSGGGAIDPVWTDDDTNNDATMLDKSTASSRLNDYVQYYYRVTAVDTVGNRSEIIPADSFGIPLNTNFDDNITPDVTPPVPSATVSVTPIGLDGVNDEPNNQQMDISWSTAVDARTPGRVPEGEGSGTVTYKIYRTTGNSSVPTGVFAEIATRAANQGLMYSDKGLAQDTYYYYKILAIDNSNNPTTNPTDYLSATNPPARTKNSQVPTTPTEIQVQAVKGNPKTDENVGKQAVFSFTGSAIKFAVNKITGYEIYRSTTNFPDDPSWLAAEKVFTFNNLDISGYEGSITYDIRRQFTDSGLSDATTYYYRVRAIGLNSTTGVVESGLSGVSVGILHSGWDTTPDITAPVLPTELKVKDIHDDGVSFKRNIITWKRIDNPSRNGINDFKEYKLYRSNDGLTWSQVCRSSLVPSCTSDNPNPLYSNDQNLAMATNYYIDLIPNSQANQYYFYYVTSTDNAGTNYRYTGVAGAPLINANYSNESDPLRDGTGKIVSVSLNPSITQPSINTLANGKKANLDSVGVSSATISWETDQPCDSLIEYRKAGTSDKFIAAGDTEMRNSHTVTLRALDPLTSYEYRLLSRNYLANTATASGDLVPTLTTVGFTITHGIIETTTSTARITWTTNLDADSNFVEYQLQKQPGDQDFSSIAGDPVLSKSHEVIIKGLRSARTYTYKIRSISLDKYVAETTFLTFKTKNFDQEQFTLTPSSTNVAERNITATTALIAWQTSIPTTSWVDYSVTSGTYDMSAGNNDLNTQHAIQLEGLVPGTKYYYRVRVKDANEVEYISQEYSFVAVLKPKIENFRIDEIKPYKVSISWTTNVETETLVNWGKTVSYGEKRGKSEMSKSHILNIDGLEDNTEYHFQILAHDAAGNEVADSDKNIRTPLDTEGPKIQSVKTDILPMGSSDETASVIISWTTDKPATTMVEYDEGIISGKYSQRSIEDASLNLSHTVIIKDLKPASSYHFKLISKDKRGNVGQSQDYTFVTPTKEKSILQLILKSLEDTFAWTKNMNQFFNGVGKRFRGR